MFFHFMGVGLQGVVDFQGGEGIGPLHKVVLAGVWKTVVVIPTGHVTHNAMTH